MDLNEFKKELEIIIEHDYNHTGSNASPQYLESLRIIKSVYDKLKEQEQEEKETKRLDVAIMVRRLVYLVFERNSFGSCCVYINKTTWDKLKPDSLINFKPKADDTSAPNIIGDIYWTLLDSKNNITKYRSVYIDNKLLDNEILIPDFSGKTFYLNKTITIPPLFQDSGDGKKITLQNMRWI